MNFLYRSKSIDKCIQSQGSIKGLEGKRFKGISTQDVCQLISVRHFEDFILQSLFEKKYTVVSPECLDTALVPHVKIVICCRIIGSRPVRLYKLTSRPYEHNKLYTPFCSGIPQYIYIKQSIRA